MLIPTSLGAAKSASRHHDWQLHLHGELLQLCLQEHLLLLAVAFTLSVLAPRHSDPQVTNWQRRRTQLLQRDLVLPRPCRA